MQECGKLGSGVRLEEVVPDGRRDVTRRTPAIGIFPYCGNEQVAKALLRRSLVRENRGYCRSGRAALMPRNNAHRPFPPADGMRPDQ